MGIESYNTSKNYQNSIENNIQSNTRSLSDKLMSLAIKVDKLLFKIGFAIQPYSYFLEQKSVNFAFKGMTEEKFLNRFQTLADFQGQATITALKTNLDYAKKYYAIHKSNLSSEEKKEFKELIKHREILYNNFIVLSSQFISQKGVMKHYNQLIDNLKNPENSVSLKNGSTSVTLPLQTKRHYSSLEIQRDTSGQHYLIIHDRAGFDFGCSQIILDGKKYGKISPRIPLTENQLKDPRIVDLLLSSPNKDPEQFYKELLTILNEKITEQSPQEKAFKEYLFNRFGENTTYNYEDLDLRGQELFRQLMDEDPSFGSFQSMGTCTESNQTGPEINIISSSFKKSLKAFVIEDLIKRIESSFFWILVHGKSESEVIVKGLNERVTEIKGKKKPQGY